MSSNWNVTKTEMSPKLKCHQNWNVTKTEMLPKLKCHKIKKCHKNLNLNQKKNPGDRHWSPWSCCFKSYGDFAKSVDYAYWFSCIGKGLPLQPVQQDCLYKQSSPKELKTLKNIVSMALAFSKLSFHPLLKYISVWLRHYLVTKSLLLFL